MKIIDAHLHFRPEVKGFSQTAEAAGHKNDEKHLQEVWKENQIVYGIVMSNKSMELEDHVYPENMSYCIGLDSSCLKGEVLDWKFFLDKTELHLKRKNCVGIKVYPGYVPYAIDDPVYIPFLELAETYQKPVAVHTGETSRSDAFLKYSHPLTLDHAAARFLKVQFVMCHFGNPWLVDAAAVLSKNPNVCADLSGILVGNPDIEKFLKESKSYIEYCKMWLSYLNDYDRILFGTDWPIIHIASYIRFISELIPEREQEKVFYHNAKRIYGLEGYC